MKYFLLIISTVLLASACNSSNTSDVISISTEDLTKMNTSDFETLVTLEIMDGQLKGTHVFKRDSKIKNQMFNIGVKNGPGYKDEITKPGSLYLGTIDAEQSDYYLISLSKNFTGMIKEGSYPATKTSSPLVIENKGKKDSWIRATGEIKKNSDITFTKVGEWLTIKRKREVRRVEGSFTDQIEFKFTDRNNLLATEIVDVKVTFSLMETYRPKSSNIAR